MSTNVIEIWKSIIETSNPSNLENIIHEDALFYSPVVYLPQHGKKNVLKYLHSAVKAFKGKKFKYNDNIFSKDLHFFAEFNAYFSKIEVNGVDIIRLEKGLIKEFKVFLRPIQGIEVVWNEMKKKLNDYDNNLSQ